MLGTLTAVTMLCAVPSPCEKAAQLNQGMTMKQVQRVFGKPGATAQSTRGVKQDEWACWVWDCKHCPESKVLQVFFRAKGTGWVVRRWVESGAP